MHPLELEKNLQGIIDTVDALPGVQRSKIPAAVTTHEDVRQVMFSAEIKTQLQIVRFLNEICEALHRVADVISEKKLNG